MTIIIQTDLLIFINVFLILPVAEKGPEFEYEQGKRFLLIVTNVFLILPVAEDGPGFAHGQGKSFSSSKRVQTGYGTHPASHSMTAGFLS
jgi:hypothetical protein